jgi:hypothetical protein
MIHETLIRKLQIERRESHPTQRRALNRKTVGLLIPTVSPYRRLVSLLIRSRIDTDASKIIRKESIPNL